MSDRILITGGHILSFDDTVGDIPSGNILIENGKIAAVGDVEASDCYVIGAHDHIVIPGLVDSHSHLWEWTLRNIGVDWSLHDYHRVIRGIFGGLYRPEDIYAATLLGGVEMLMSGVTSVFDCSHNINSPEHADAAIAALREVGIRGTFAYGSANSDWTPSDHLNARVQQRGISKDAYRVKSEYFSSDDSLLRMGLASRGVRGEGGLQALATDVQMGRELAIPITFSFGRRKRAADGQSQLDELHSAGLTGPDILYYHGDQFDERDLDLIAETGGHTAYTPENELRAAYAVPSIGHLLEHGIPTGVGVDTPAISSDYFNAMRAALAADGAALRLEHSRADQAASDVERVRLGVRDVLELATVGGANASWVGDRAGSLTPGKAADIALISKKSLSTTRVYDPVGSIVYNGTPAAVDTVIVDGRIAKLGGRFLAADLARVVALAEESRAYLFGKAGIDPYATGI